MNQPPTLASVPGILLRTSLRLVARVLFCVAAVVLLLGAGLAFSSLLLSTWRTPRTRRVQLAVDIVLLTTELIKERRRVTQTDSHGD